MSFRRILRFQVALPLGAALVFSLLVAFLLLWSSAGSGVPGLGGDPYQTLWRMRLMAEQLRTGHLPIAPEPFRNLGPLPWLPLSLFLGAPAGYALVWVLQFPLAVVSTMVLGRVYGVSSGASALAGVLVALAPYRLAQSLGHFGAMQLFWLPLTLAALRHFIRRPTLGRAMAAGAALIGTAWTEHTLFLTTLIGCVVVAAAARPDLSRVLQTTRGRISTLALAVVLLGGAVAPFAREITATAQPRASALQPPPWQRLRFSPTPGALVSPSPFSLLAGSALGYGTPRETAADRVHTLGLFLAAAAALSLLEGFRRARPELPWVLLGGSLLGLALAFAPRTPLDHALFSLPVFGAVRTVDRFLALPVVLLPLAAARAAFWGPGLLRVGVAALLLLEVLPAAPFPRVRVDPPPFLHALEGVPGSLLVVPAATDYLVASRALYDASFHGRPLVGQSAFARVAAGDDRDELLRVPGLRDILLLRLADLAVPSFFGQDLRRITRLALLSEGIRAVVLVDDIAGGPVVGGSALRPVAVGADEIERVRAFLTTAGLPATARAGASTLHVVPPLAPGETGAVFVQGSGWARPARRADGVIQAALTKETAFQVRLFGAERQAAFSARVATGSHRGTVTLASPLGRVTAAATPGQRLRLSLGTLPEGKTTVRLGVDGPEIILENPTITLAPPRLPP